MVYTEITSNGEIVYIEKDGIPMAVDVSKKEVYTYAEDICELYEHFGIGEETPTNVLAIAEEEFQQGAR